MFNTTYLPHVLYSIAITTISIHLVSRKRAIADDRARIAARFSILESVASQLRDSKPISLEELDRLQQLARPSSSVERVQPTREEIGWKETIFGRKRSLEPEMNEYDRRDWEKVRREIEKEE